MDNREIIIMQKNLINPTHRCEHAPYEYYKYEVIKKSEEQGCAVALYEIPPNKANYPYHYHVKNEEIFYIISGHGVIETPTGYKSIGPGDIIVCPPSEKGAHRMINSSETETLTYLDVDTVHSPDVAFYPHSHKVGILINGQSHTFYKKQTHVNYYEGE